MLNTEEQAEKTREIFSLKLCTICNMSQVVSKDTYPCIIIIFLEKMTKLILAFLDHIIFIKNKLVKILDFSKVVVIIIHWV